MFIITHSTHWPGEFFIQFQGIQCLKATASGLSLQTQTSVPHAVEPAISETRVFLPHKNTIWSMQVRWKKREQLAYLFLFPAWQKFREKQSMGWSQKSIKSSLSITGLTPACGTWLQLRAHLPANGTHPPRPVQLSAKQHFLPYELAGQMFHKMIYFIPMVQDTSWSREKLLQEILV